MTSEAYLSGIGHNGKNNDIGTMHLMKLRFLIA
jgi:hypothetical protein